MTEAEARAAFAAFPGQLRLGRFLGGGSMGVVFAAESAGRPLAVKVVLNVFGCLEDLRRLLRELRALTAVATVAHPNIVGFVGAAAEANTLVFVYDRCDASLGQHLRHPRHRASDRRSLDPDIIRYLMYQMLSALDYLHRRNLVHCDVKPENTLVMRNCHLRLTDFGLTHAAPVAPELLQTDWYRAPEVIDGSRPFGAPIDMWSAGCVFAELLRAGRAEYAALFPHSGDNLRDGTNALADAIMELIGGGGARLRELFDFARPAAHLLCQMLSLDPTERPTAAEALAHPYFEGAAAFAAAHLAGGAAAVTAPTTAVDMSDIDGLPATEPALRAKLVELLATARWPTEAPIKSE